MQDQTNPNSSAAISPGQLSSGTSLQTVPPPVNTTDHNAITQGVTQSVMNDYASLNNQKNADQQNQTNTGSDILNVMNALTGKTADTQAANTAAGVDTANTDVNNYTQQLADLNSQASSLNRAAQAIPIQTQQRNANTGATDAGIAPQNTGALRENALKALSIGQQADVANAALTGSNIRLQAAKDKAQQIIDLKYKPLEDELAIKQQQYSLNKDQLDSIDKDRSEALQVSLNKEASDLATQKQNATDVSNLQMKLAENQAPSDIYNQVGQAKTLTDALQIKGIAPYIATGSFSHFTDPNTGVTTIYDTKTGLPKGTYGGTSQNVSTSSSGAALPATTVTLKSGDDPAVIAKAHGIDVDTLKSLNPGIDLNNIPVGGTLNLPPQESTVAPYKEYGLLSNTNFNPNDTTDKSALLYMNQYLQGITPSSRSLGIKASAQGFSDISQRARDLYSTATGNPLPPTPDVLKANTTLLNNNNKLLNNLGIQSGTVDDNFKLALDNLNNNDLNQSLPFINKLVTGYQNSLGNPYAAQALSQNATLSTELGNLLAVKNAGGTTVYDKMSGAELLPANASAEQKAQVFKTILTEAQNAAGNIKDQNDVLTRSIDPFQMSADNPDRLAHLNGTNSNLNNMDFSSTNGIPVDISTFNFKMQ